MTYLLGKHGELAIDWQQFLLGVSLHRVAGFGLYFMLHLGPLTLGVFEHNALLEER